MRHVLSVCSIKHLHMAAFVEYCTRVAENAHKLVAVLTALNRDRWESFLHLVLITMGAPEI